MTILILDQTTSFLCLGIYHQGTYYGRNSLVLGYTSYILTELDNLLQYVGITLDDIQYLAEGQGPGSFVGRKISNAVIQGLLVNRRIKIIHFSSMMARACTQVAWGKESQVLLHANCNHFYYGKYAKEVISESLIKKTPSRLSDLTNTWGDARAQEFYPHCNLISLPLDLSKILPFIQNRIQLKKFNGIEKKSYLL